MADLKTKITDQSVEKFLQTVADPARREDCYEILRLMQSITQEEPKMWGKSIIGFGQYHYKYESGREGDWFLTGFSPRKQNLTLYIMAGFSRYEEILQELGTYKTGKSCLYINKLSDVNITVLKELTGESVNHMKNEYNT